MQDAVTATLNSRLGLLAHELRNYLRTAMLVVAAIKMGNVPISGTTGAVLDRSLLGMRSLIDNALAEVRVPARMRPQPNHSEVCLLAHVVSDRVLIDIEDRCGGLPEGAVAKMFLPFAQYGEDRSGVGLGLEISRRGGSN